MSYVESSANAIKCNERVVVIRNSLFGETLGNEHRDVMASIRVQGRAAVAIAETRKRLIDAVFKDPAMALASLSQLAKRQPHAAAIYLALDLAHLCLTMPSSPEAQEPWVRDVMRLKDKPVALVMACLETLEQSFNNGKFVAQG